jgi:glycerol-3-phosphate dehydrogenase (NAD(P)+)
MPSFKSVAVIGAGAWGTALAGVAARAGREVVLYARSPERAAEIAATRANPKLSGARLDASIGVTDDLASAARADIILIATPAQNLREAVTALAPHLAKATPVIACAKGIERGTHKFMTEVIAEAASDAIPAILSGPSFAAKNVLAIAAGIVVGKKFGASAQAALTTRGFSELVRLGRACGARSETMAGLSGLGDLILSCASPQSRNFALGVALGRGERPPRDRLAEGEFTAPVLIELAASQNVDMPVSNAVAAILSGAVTIDAAIESLLTRPFKAEG